jgi:hypothetical protein
MSCANPHKVAENLVVAMLMAAPLGLSRACCGFERSFACEGFVTSRKN